MPNMDAWLGNSFPLGDWIGDTSRRVDTARLIADKPTIISVTPVDGRTVAAQTVRIEALNEYAQQQRSEGGEAATLRVIVIGYKNHATIADTDLVRGDRFLAEGTLFDIVLIQPGHADRLIAIGEARK